MRRIVGKADMPNIDLSKVDNYTLTKYVQTFQDKIFGMTKEQLISKIRMARDLGVSVSVEKTNQIVQKLTNAKSDADAGYIIACSMMAGEGMGVEKGVRNRYYRKTSKTRNYETKF
ncbi:MAG: hypothetical protein CMB80_02110 [Flammeovirgaceae bacterium]|nr:hypothetical protein [Flammeovirgaceae bacterium]|tara:strand:- start:813 stop:1160 length:348 start_codon:yes stop_codon:yes gene_type:complete